MKTTLTFTALLITAACGEAPINQTPVPTPYPVTHETTTSCVWIDPNATFYQYNVNDTTLAPAADANIPTWTVDAAWGTDNDTFTVTLQIDANNVPWVTVKEPSHTYGPDVCLSTVELDDTHFTSMDYNAKTDTLSVTVINPDTKETDVFTATRN